ncbi:hypothetical protein [Aquirufa sp. ROCK2-A2]
MKNQLKNSTEVTKNEEFQIQKKSWQEPKLTTLILNSGINPRPLEDTNSVTS